MAAAPQPIVALDVSSLAAAREIVEGLGERAGFYKVGLQLFTAEGPAAVSWLRSRNKRVFLDLKLHDIPNTVQQAARRAAALGAELLTVHGVGGARMIGAAIAGAAEGAAENGETAGVLVVTVLTSMDLADASGALGRPLRSIREEVLRVAALAHEAGAHGVVCGGAECASVGSHPGWALRVLVPGIRPAGVPEGDQRQLTTPADAAEAGASYVVLGRAVTAAADPPAAFEAVVAQLRG